MDMPGGTERALASHTSVQGCNQVKRRALVVAVGGGARPAALSLHGTDAARAWARRGAGASGANARAPAIDLVGCGAVGRG